MVISWTYLGHVWDRIADKSEDVRERGQEWLQCVLPLPDTTGPHLLNEQNLDSLPPSTFSLHLSLTSFMIYPLNYFEGFDLRWLSSLR